MAVPAVKKRASAGGPGDRKRKPPRPGAGAGMAPEAEVSRLEPPTDEIAAIEAGAERFRSEVVEQSPGDASVALDVKTRAPSTNAAIKLKDRPARSPSSEVKQSAAPPIASVMEDVARATSDPLDRLVHAREARFTGSLSPASLTLAYLDWALHLANAPGRQLELTREAGRQWARLLSPGHWTAPAHGDRRFTDPAWSRPPFNVISQAFLLAEEWWRDATLGPPGVAKSHSDVVAFAARQILDVFSPSNSVLTNPEVLGAAAKEAGWNFAKGFRNYLVRLRTASPWTRQMDSSSAGMSPSPRARWCCAMS